MENDPNISRFLLSPDEEEDDTVMAPIAGGHWDESPLPPPIAPPTPRRAVRDTPTVAVRLRAAAPARPPLEARRTALPVVSFLSGFWAIAGFMLGAWWAS